MRAVDGKRRGTEPTDEETTSGKLRAKRGREGGKRKREERRAWLPLGDK